MTHDYDPKCTPCQEGYHEPPHVYEKEPLPDGATYVYVLPSDVLVISGLEGDVSSITEEFTDSIRDRLGVREVLFIEGPANFAVIREELKS